RGRSFCAIGESMPLSIKPFGEKPPTDQKTGEELPQYWPLELTLTMFIAPHLVRFTDCEDTQRRAMLLGKLFEANIRRILAMTVGMTNDQIDDLSHQEDRRADVNEFPDI